MVALGVHVKQKLNVKMMVRLIVKRTSLQHLISNNSPPAVSSFNILVRYENLMQTIDQLNETIQILNSEIAIKDATMKKLQERINIRSNETIASTELSMVIVIPDKIDHHGGEVVKIKQNPIISH